MIVASGTSNRQTKALAASVRDAVKEAGGDVVAPRARTTANGSSSTAAPRSSHIMQPAIRQYYHLEEIWGDKPVRDEARPRRRARVGIGAAPERSPLAQTSAASADERSRPRSRPQEARGRRQGGRKAPASKTPPPSAC